MKYDLLKKEFAYFGSFMIWDNSIQKNGLPKKLDNKEFRDERLNSDFIYLAMNIRLDKKNFKDIDNDFLTNDEIFTSDMPAFCSFHSLDDGKYNNTPYTRLNKLYSNTVLEGAYITDFFKVAPNSKIPNGYATKTSDEVFLYLYSLSKEDRDNFLRYQLLALERELELLEIENPKFIVMELIYDLVKYSFDKFVNKKDFPNLYRAKIVDKPSSFGTVLNKYQRDIIHIFLKNLDYNSYPEFLIAYLEKYSQDIVDLKFIKSKADLMAIFYICLEDYDDFPNDIKSYLDKIKISYKDLIENIKKSFSKDFIYELIKNFPFIYSDESMWNEYIEKFYKDLAEDGMLVNISQNLSYIINLFKVKEIENLTFLSKDFDTYIFIFLFKKALNLQGNIYYKDLVKDFKYPSFFSLINKANYKLVEKILDGNNFSFTNLLLSYEAFNSLYFKNLKEKLFNKDLYLLINFNNENILISTGKNTNKIEYKYYDDKCRLFLKEIIEKKNLKNDPLSLSLNENAKIKKSLKLSDFLLSIKRGYPTVELNDDWVNNSNSKKGVKYLSNSNINKGFVDHRNCLVYELIDEDKEKSYNYAEKGDIIITKNSPYSASIVDRDEKYLVNDNCFILKVDKNKIDPFYILAFLSSKKLIRSINTNVLSIKKIKSLPINLHSSSDIEDISAKMKKIIIDLEVLYENFLKLDHNRKNVFNSREKLK